MKILYLSLSGPFNDDWGYQDNLLPKYNVLDGHEVTVIAPTQVNSTDSSGFRYVNENTYFSKDGFKIIRVDFVKYLPLMLKSRLRVYKSIKKIIEKEKPDFIFVHGFNFINLLEVLSYLKKNPQVYCVADSHASYDNSAHNFLSRYILHGIIWKYVAKLLVPYIKTIYAIAPGCKEFLLKMYDIPESMIEYLYLGADTETIKNMDREKESRKIRAELNIGSDDFVLITGGKLSQEKKLGLLLQAFLRLEDKNIKLIVFGELGLDVDDITAELLNLSSAVRYVGWLESKKIYSFYFASDAAIFPGTKSALWEQAICSGLPLICKKWEGMEYVDVGGNCLFLTEDNAKEIEDAILLLVNDRTQYYKMQHIAKTKGYDTFSYENIARQAIEIKDKNQCKFH